MKRKSSANAARSVAHQADFKVNMCTRVRVLRPACASRSDGRRRMRSAMRGPALTIRLSLSMYVHIENQAQSWQEGAHQGKRHKYQLRDEESVEEGAEAQRRMRMQRGPSARRPPQCSSPTALIAHSSCAVLLSLLFIPAAIHVPTQKLHVDNTAVSADAAAAASALTNARHLNLHDLFGQIKHYNVNVRRGHKLQIHKHKHR